MKHQGIKKLVAAGDFHIPYHDPVLLGLFYEFLNNFKPDILVINGDFLDCFSISKFDKIPNRGLSLKNEISLGKDILQRFRNILPNAEIYYIEGNHEFRLRKITISQAPGLYDLTTLEEQLELRRLNIKWIGTKENASKWVDTYKRFGQLYVGHFNKVARHSAYTAKALVEEKGISLVQAHVHRLGKYYKTLEDNNQTKLVGIEGGCMCDTNPSYMGHANWQQGWVVAYIDTQGSERFHAYDIPVLGYKFFFNDKIYEANKPKKLEIEVL